MGNSLKNELFAGHDKLLQLSQMRENISRGAYPGYPVFSGRLVAPIEDLERNDDGRLVIPNGQWTIDNHFNQRKPELSPGFYLQQELSGAGYELDSLGRPLHPWLNDMIVDPTLGVVNGKGFYWKWGPSYTVDPIVLCMDSVLLVQRGDTGDYALPGGFIDSGETARNAGLREVYEETGFVIPATAFPIEVYQGIVSDVRVTANAWPVTTALLYELDNISELPHLRGSEENPKSIWAPVEQVLNGGLLYGSHLFLLRKALGHTPFLELAV